MSAPTSSLGAPPSNTDPDVVGELLSGEIWWRDHQKWLVERGYMLRQRYRHDWVPSWKGKDIFSMRQEDGIWLHRTQIIDATRLSDGAIVALKQISTKTHPLEAEISQIFSAEPLASHPHNHCVPIFEVLRVPDEPETVLLVMPLLRRYDDPQFDTVGEAIEYFRQVFEGLQFMHEHHVAHRDCMNLNIMMDPKYLFPKLFHPQKINRSYDFKGSAKHYTRTLRPVKYYLIDFGLSRRYNPKDGPPREYPIWGGDKTVPEFHRSDEACDPFPTDIYYLGNMIREDFLQGYRGVEFMQPLVGEMVHDDPTRRPTIDQVISSFAGLSSSLGYWQLRARLSRRDEHWLVRLFKAVRHILRTARYIITFRPPVPRP